MPGNVNRVDSFGVVGWAATEDRSAGDVIEISVDGEPCATVLASQSRPALRERGIADGKCGFRYDFDKPIAVTRPATVEIRSAKTRRPLGGVPRTVEPWLTTGDGYRLNLQQRFHAVLLNDAIRRDDELRVRALVFAPRDARLRVIPVNSVPGVSIGGTTVTPAEYDGYDFNADAGDGAQCHLLSFSVHGFRTHPDDVLHLVVADDNASARQLGTMGICIPLRTDWVTLPTEENWVRTSGRELTARGFIDTGVNSASRICSIAREYMALDGPITVLDWGVGCGRIAIPLKRRFLPDANVVGLDVDEFNIRWCRDNVRDITATVCDLYPPLDLEADSVDLIYGSSVMTHLTRDAQICWLRELKRVLKPGGICLLSTHGDYFIARAKNLSAMTLRLLKEFGISDVEYNRAGLGPMLPMKGYYRGTFETRRYVEEVWSRHMRVVDYLPIANGRQDFVVLTK